MLPAEADDLAQLAGVHDGLDVCDDAVLNHFGEQVFLEHKPILSCAGLFDEREVTFAQTDPYVIALVLRCGTSIWRGYDTNTLDEYLSSPPTQGGPTPCAETPMARRRV